MPIILIYISIERITVCTWYPGLNLQQGGAVYLPKALIRTMKEQSNGCSNPYCILSLRRQSLRQWKKSMSWKTDAHLHLRFNRKYTTSELFIQKLKTKVLILRIPKAKGKKSQNQWAWVSMRKILILSN